MKHNRIIALALLFALALSAPALAAAGGADDPLISRSYAEETFRAEVDAALDAVVAAAAARPGQTGERAPSDSGLRVVSMNAGDTVTLRDGQQLILLSGGVRLTVGGGNLVNATLGRASTGGDARTGHRYVAWGGASVTAEAGAKGATAAVSPVSGAHLNEAPDTEPEPEGALPFVDVLADDWFYPYVAGAWRRGLVNGMDATHYAPRENMTLAQAVKLAACMHQLRRDGEVTLENAGGNAPWYYTYAGYALEYGILDEMTLDGWDKPIDRARFVRLFYRALPAEEYAAINDIPDGAIPDVPADADIAREVYAFYAAGILTGYTDDGVHRAGAFDPGGQITRAEVATIMHRMFEPDARVRFEMG